MNKNQKRLKIEKLLIDYVGEKLPTLQIENQSKLDLVLNSTPLILEYLKESSLEGFESLLYHYKGTVKEIYDGDTSTHLLLDLGFRSYLDISGRIAGIDTAEMRGGTKESKALAQYQKAALEDAILDKVVYIQSEGKSFDRWVLRIWFEHSIHGWISVDEYMINYHEAEPYSK